MGGKRTQVALVALRRQVYSGGYGTAFGKIVNSLVNDVIMPPTGILINGVDFKALALTLKQGPDAKTTVTLNYGNFIQNVIEFLIIAWSVFLLVKVLNRIRRLGAKPAHRAE